MVYAIDSRMGTRFRGSNPVDRFKLGEENESGSKIPDLDEEFEVETHFGRQKSDCSGKMIVGTCERIRSQSRSFWIGEQRVFNRKMGASS
jgi:hypothetical protein